MKKSIIPFKLKLKLFLVICNTKLRAFVTHITQYPNLDKNHNSFEGKINSHGFRKSKTIPPSEDGGF